MNSFSEKYIKYYFIVPVVTYIFIVALFPLLFSIYMSFSKWAPGYGLSFIGITNFKYIFTDNRFYNSAILTFIYVFSLIFLEFIIGTFLAYLLHKNIKGKNIFRVLFMLPMLLSPVAVSYVWKMILDSNIGPANYFLSMIGIAPIEWLSGNYTSVISLIIVDVWQWAPFMTLTILAAFESLPKDLFEAALVDGSSNFSIFTKIMFPLCLPIIITITLLRTIDAFKVFDTVYILTGGGPGTSTEILNFYIYLKGFRNFDLGYGTAMSWIQLIVIIILFMYVTKLLKGSGALR